MWSSWWLVVLSLLAGVRGEEEVGEGEGSYRIEGKITPPDVRSHTWFTEVTIVTDGGKRRAFLRDDNSFVFQARTGKKSVGSRFEPAARLFIVLIS
jgi:hypothetical protein